MAEYFSTSHKMRCVNFGNTEGVAISESANSDENLVKAEIERKGSLTAVEHTRLYREKHPEKRKAHRVMWKAVKAGRIVRPTSCSECGKECRPHGHHDDYSKPLEVRWLCNSCHKRHHYKPTRGPYRRKSAA